MLRQADQLLKRRWARRFDELPPAAREALRAALLDLRADAAYLAELQWKRRKGPMALYWRVVSVYSGHLARALRPTSTSHRSSLPTHSP